MVYILIAVRSSLSRAYSSPARRRSSNDHLIK